VIIHRFIRLLLLAPEINSRQQGRTGEIAARLVKAGADMIVTGTIVEQVSDIKSKISELVGAIKQ
jgi:hypothetical protein